MEMAQNDSSTITLESLARAQLGLGKKLDKLTSTLDQAVTAMSPDGSENSTTLCADKLEAIETTIGEIRAAQEAQTDQTDLPDMQQVIIDELDEILNVMGRTDLQADLASTIATYRAGNASNPPADAVIGILP